MLLFTALPERLIGEITRSRPDWSHVRVPDSSRQTAIVSMAKRTREAIWIFFIPIVFLLLIN